MSNRLAILFPLANPVWGFQSLDFSVSPAVPVPNQGLGRGLLVLGARLRHRQHCGRQRRSNIAGLRRLRHWRDLLIVDGNPLEDISLLADPEKNLKVIMKDGKIYKNTIH